MRVAIVLVVGLVGCTDDEPSADPYKCMAGGGGGCFEMPTHPIAAADPAGAAVTPDLSCGAYTVTTAAAPVTFSGYTINARTMALTAGVRVELFADLGMTSLLGEVTSDATGNYSLTVPAMPSLVHGRTSGDGLVPIYHLHRRVDVGVTEHDNTLLEVAAKADLASTIEQVGDQFLPGKSQITGLALDCSGNRLVHVIANIAPSSGANGSRLFESGVKTYYAIEGDASVFGRRTQLMQTTSSGGFAATNVAPGRHFVQLWGFATEMDVAIGHAALALVGEVEVVVPSDESGLVVPVYGRSSS